MSLSSKSRSSFDLDALRLLLDECGCALSENSVSLITTCPKCSKPKKLYFRKRDGRFVCWRCAETEGFQGRPEYALAEMTGLGIGAIRAKLYGDIDGQLGATSIDIRLCDFYGEDEAPEDDDEIVVGEIPSMSWEWDAYPLLAKEAMYGVAYLLRRGIPLEVAVEYGIRYQPKSWRVLFPVIVGGRLLGWQGRYTLDGKVYDENGNVNHIPKALSTKEIPRDRTFMFADRMLGSEHVVLCEGPVDALKAHLCGGNVASLGKAVSAAQVQVLRRAGVRKIYLALDPDAADETARLVQEFDSELEVYHMVPPSPYGDLGDMPMDEVLELFRRAPRVSSSNVFLFLHDPY